MYVCGGGKEKRKVGGYMGGGEKKEKRHGEWGLCVRWEKRESEKERRKKMKGTKLNWFYLYVHFIWCKV